MTSEMQKDYIKILKKRNRLLTILVIVFAGLFVGMSIFAFSNFEITTEDTTIIEYDAQIGDGDYGNINQVNSTIEKDYNNLLYICIAIHIIFLIIILFIGVYFYGKNSKNENYKNKENYNKEKISDKEKEIVEDGKAD